MLATPKEYLKTKDLKKGMIVFYYGALFEVLEDAKNHGQRCGYHDLDKEIKNNDLDVWSAKCVCVESKEKDLIPLLRNFDSFQGNSLSKVYEIVKS